MTTPLTADARGNVYFGFTTSGGAPLGLSSGIARLSRSGRGTWVSAGDRRGRRDHAAGAVTARRRRSAPTAGGSTSPCRDAAPAGYLVVLDSATLAPLGACACATRRTRARSRVLSDDGTASPTVGPDGDVYFGVLPATREPLPRLAAPLQRRPPDDEDAGRVRLGRHAVDRPGGGRGVLRRHVVVSPAHEVQRLRRRRRHGAEPHGDPRSVRDHDRPDLRRDRHAGGAHGRRADARRRLPRQSARRARVVHQHGRRRSADALGARQQRGRQALSLGPRRPDARRRGRPDDRHRRGVHADDHRPRRHVYAINNATLFAVDEGL